MADRPSTPVPTGDLSALLREYLPILSHDVRTPMTAIKGAAGVLAGGLVGALSEHQMEFVRICQRNADLATLLVQDVVELLRLRGGQAETHPTEFDIVSEARAVWQDLALHTNLPVRLEGDAGEILFRTDRYYFRQAVSALIRFPQPYRAVTDASLSLGGRSDGIEMALTCAPITRREAHVEELLTTTVRGQRQLEGRLRVTGLELPFLSALAARFSTQLSTDSPSAESLRIRLFWPAMVRVP